MAVDATQAQTTQARPFSGSASTTRFARDSLVRRLAGVVTTHRVAVVVCLVLGVIGLYALQDALWSGHYAAHSGWQAAWGWGSLLWLGSVLPGTLGLVGLFAFRHPRHLARVEPISTLVSFRIVSRGDNVEALTSTIRRCQEEMARTELFPYVIEVVTDHRSTRLPAPNDDLVYIDVPADYATANGSLYKARALQYALEHSALPADAWIVHLDEETQPTASGIRGIAAMIAEEEMSGKLRIGQGAILYHRSWRAHPFLTLADNVRTGDDFARFHFQHRLGVTVFGLHGSYIVVRNDIESAIGFDFGPVGSITEDAFWALKAMEHGHRCRWVVGYLEEQSTQSVGDFVKQRRRWFQGLAKVSLHAPVKRRWRICLGTNTLLWALAPFATIYTVAHLFYGATPEPWVRLLANYSFSSFATLYLIGLFSNLKEHGITNVAHRLGWTVAQIVLLPVFNLMEGAGVMTALLKPVAGFHVVKK